jgi:hypothetical protein
VTSETTWADRALHYIRHIVNRIGPRGAATPEEKRAAEYAHQQMQQLGLQQTRLTPFAAPFNGWQIRALVFSIAVWGVFFCWGAFYLTQTSIIGGLLGALLCGIALGILYLEMTFRNHPLRRYLSRGRSYNAIGQIPPASTLKQRVVLVSHLDTPPAARVFKTPRRRRLFNSVFAAGAGSLCLSVVLYLLGGLDVWAWAFVFAGICSLLQSAVIIQLLQADRGELTPGANHNASGVGVALALAERLQGSPLNHTDVWVACCGSQTTGSVGLQQLLKQHADELREAWFIGFEGVGRGEHLIFLTQEGWLRRSLHPKVRDLLEQTLRANPDRIIEGRATRRTTTVGAAAWRGFKSLCLSVYADQNRAPGEYHREDTLPLLQPAALEAAQEFGWSLLHQIDQLEPGLATVRAAASEST